MREAIRHSNKIRKKLNLKPKDKVISLYSSSSDVVNRALEKNKDFIARETSSEVVQIGGETDESFDYEEEIKIDGTKIKIAIKKIS